MQRCVTLDIAQSIPVRIQRQRQHDDVFPNAWTKLLGYGLEHRCRTRTNPSASCVEELQNDAFVANELAHLRWPDMGLHPYVSQAIYINGVVIDTMLNPNS
jgi:hypothetical protein